MTKLEKSGDKKENEGRGIHMNAWCKVRRTVMGEMRVL